MSIRDTKLYTDLQATYKAGKWIIRPKYMQLMAQFRKNGVLPSFLIVGAPKCGTTSLFSYICQHPGMVPPVMKEVGYLNNPKNHKYGENWYRAHFPRQAAMDKLAVKLGYQPITGEATPAMNLNIYPINAQKLIPNAKIIMILRNPVDRAFSQYHHQMRKFRRELLPFWDALQAEPGRIAIDIEKNKSYPEDVGISLRR